ncbi:MAG: peptidyl-prolyl cis-trans isomerase [Phycisphaerae bacterium]|nr:peptidyl-prolyl cis-trans isomerase [Phycisphaerae bacterium]
MVKHRDRQRTSFLTAIAVCQFVAFGACQKDDGQNRDVAERWAERRSQNDSAPTSQSAQPAADDDGSPTAPIHAVLSDGLMVNSEIITVNDILEPIQPEIDKLAASLTEELYYRRVLELVRQQIVDAVAHLLIYRRASQSITTEMEPAIKKAIEQMERERIGREFHGLETEYENHLQKKKTSRESVKQRLRRVIVVDSYLRERLLPRIPAPSKRELYKYYQEHIADYTIVASRELYLIDIPIAAFFERDILLRKRPPLPEEERLAAQLARDEAEAALRELNSGKDFEEVARVRSHGPHKEDGGFWGALRSPMAGRWKTPYEHFMQMREGEVSPIIEASKSFFIVKVGKVEEARVRSFEEVQPEIVQELRNERFHRLKSEFLQSELETSTIGSLELFVRQVMSNTPPPERASEESKPGRN